MRAYAILITCVALTSACEAGFTDFRPEGIVNQVGSSTIDAGFVDGGAVEVMAATLADGDWRGRGSYSGAGRVTIAIDDQGATVLRLSEDFSVSSVPGPFLVMSSRDSLGASIEPSMGDIEIGVLAESRGAQTYPIPVEAAGLPYAWVFCKPFGVEVARAELMEVP